MPINMSSLDNQFRFRPALSGGGLRTKIFPEASGADFKYGEPVMLSNSGGVNYVTQTIAMPGGANSRQGPAAGGVLILGFALANSSGAQGSPIPVLLAQGCEVLTRINTNNPGTSRLQDINVGDVCEVWRYRGATSQDVSMQVVPNTPVSTTTKLVVTERYSPNNPAPANPAFQGEQALTDIYGLVWVAVRPSLTVQGQ